MMLVLRLVRYMHGIPAVFGISFLISGFSCLVGFCSWGFFNITSCTDKSYLLRKHLFNCRYCIRHLCVLCRSLCAAHTIDSEIVGVGTKKGELGFVSIWKQPEGQASKHLLQ